MVSLYAVSVPPLWFLYGALWFYCKVMTSFMVAFMMVSLWILCDFFKVSMCFFCGCPFGYHMASLRFLGGFSGDSLMASPGFSVVSVWFL